MKTSPADQPSRQRAATDHTGPLAVEAGAGTGKTTLLVERVICGLEEGHFEISALAAITFTRKAAAELRGRLRRRLVERIGDAEGDERQRLLKAREGLPLAQLSTIHSFCGSILGDHGMAVGLAPGYRVLEGTHAADLKRQLWERWLEQRLEQDEARSLLLALTWGANLSDLARLAGMVQEQSAATYPPPSGRVLEPQVLWSRFTGQLDDLLARVGQASSDPADAFVRSLADLRRIVSRLELLSPGARIAWLLDLCDGKKVKLPKIRANLGRKANYADPELLQQLREEVVAWRDGQLPQTIRQHFAPLAGDVLSALGSFADWAIEERAERGLPDPVGPVDLDAPPAQEATGYPPPGRPPLPGGAGGRIPGHRPGASADHRSAARREKGTGGFPGR